MMTKITILGDIMCEPSLMKASRHGDKYNFDWVFENVKRLFEESDYVIGNLETPLAGKEAKYTNSLFSFNAPDEFSDSIKNAGIDMVLTANNHCLDRGVEGMIRTIKTLKRKEISFTGTYESGLERKEAEYVDINGITIAIVSYTYGTNYSANKTLLSEEQHKLINILRPQNEMYYLPIKTENKPVYKRIIRKVFHMVPEEKRFYIKKYLGMTVNTAQADNNLNKKTAEKYLAQMREDITKAKGKADVVLFCPHIGGQFNSEPGAFSEYVFNMAADCGCDLIAASHAHVVLKAEMINSVPCFYSLGNFSMSPNSVYVIQDNLPDYGIALHVYLDEKRIKKVSFSILKIVENRKEGLTVYPLDRYIELKKDVKDKKKIESEAKRIVFTVTGKKMDPFSIQKEYEVCFS